MKRTERDRRDWSLLIFVVPFGILLMILAGQLAMRIVPWWILNANMGSALSLNGQPVPIPLFNMQILTPFAWQDTYLTPSDGGGFVFPPFIVIEPSVVVATLPTDVSGVTSTPVAPIPTATLQRSTATVYIPPPLKTATSNPATDPATETKAAGATSTNTITPTPTTTGTSTVTSTTTPTKTPTLAPTGYPSTPDPGFTGPLPIDIVGPDGNIGSIPQGSYAVIDLGAANSVMIYGALDANFYELVFYEDEANTLPGYIYLDNIIIGISTDPLGAAYFEVFNWGNDNGNPSTDYNTNVAGVLEIDNQTILMTTLYSNPPYAGILIDADNAWSEPPPVVGGYRYLVIIAPIKPPPNLDPFETIDVDAIEIWQ